MTDQVANDELGAPETLVSTSPICGVGVGMAFPISNAFRLGPELRGVLIPSVNGADPLPQRGTTFGTQTGVTLALTATADFGG